MSQEIQIFDTTLRDGEQSPGCSMTLSEKLEVAVRLEALRVDVIEAGFAVASQGDYEAVQAVSAEVKDCVVASLARALPKDIDVAWDALSRARRPRIHTFIATSDIHMIHKLKKSRAEVLEIAAQAVRHAKSLCEDVEFSAEDATRTDPDFLVQVFDAAIRAGATVINVPDTVGFTTPQEFYDLIVRLRESVPGIDRVALSVHCHDDLGMAVANTLAAVRAGADPARGHDQRHRRAGRERRARGGRHVPPDTQGPFRQDLPRRHDPALPDLPARQLVDRASHPGQQGDRGRERLRPRIRHPSARGPFRTRAPTRS